MASSYPPPGGDDQNNPPSNQPPGYEPPSQGGYVPPSQGYVPPISQGGYEPPAQGGYTPPSTPSSQGAYTPPPVDYSSQGTPSYSAAPAAPVARPWYKNPLVVILGSIGLCACLGVLCTLAGGMSALRQLGGVEGLSTAVMATVEADSGTSSGLATPEPGGGIGLATPDTDDGDTGSSDEGGVEVSAFDLELGQCFNDPSDTSSVNTLTVVDCAQPHDNEIFHLVNFDAGESDPFPGEDAIDAFAEGECTGAFEGYVGTDYTSSAYYVSYYQPSESTWGDGDREIVCFLYEPDVALEGSARDSGR